MSAAAAADYLDGILVRTVPHPGWGRLLDRLRDGGPTPLSETLSSPLGLWLDAEEVPLGDKSIGVRDFAWWRLAALTIRQPPPGPGTMLLVLVASVAWGGALATLALDAFSWWFLVGGVVIITSYRERSDHTWAHDQPGYADLRIGRRIFSLLNKLLFGFSIASGIAIGLALLGGVWQAMVNFVTGDALTDALMAAFVMAVVLGPGDRSCSSS
ncbi:hypothetical protein Aph01nite_40710 [Acrocarpospora phusangensis]|uniref:Uncharacterized protein n=1 Tax=Acrocarpospora phusangensis TaxID=1070424 RepID=A0A919QD53_9ACTN|nr:hypothetical protein [Acrocarpospora phusangensis]GIH25761.1 hypothetical protein Aph01nite_40710 [Acrocarpospora phusangensis]